MNFGNHYTMRNKHSFLLFAEGKIYKFFLLLLKQPCILNLVLCAQNLFFVYKNFLYTFSFYPALGILVLRISPFCDSSLPVQHCPKDRLWFDSALQSHGLCYSNKSFMFSQGLEPLIRPLTCLLCYQRINNPILNGHSSSGCCIPDLVLKIVYSKRIQITLSLFTRQKVH